MADSKRLKFLKGIDLFKNLSEESLTAISDNVESKVFSKDEVIMTEGESDGHLCIVESGQVCVFKKATQGPSAGGDPVRLLTLGPGEVIGLGSVVDKMPHSASVTAAGPADTKVLVLSSESLTMLTKSFPEITMSLLRSTLQELRHFRSRLVNIGNIGDGDQKVKVVFFDFKPYDKPNFEVSFDALSKEFSLDVHYVAAKLNLETVSLAAGAKVVVIFVNDVCDAPVLDELRELGVELVALRCAGFNNVDLQKAESLKISVARVPAYSPYAVAEHAVSLLTCLNRKLNVAYNRARTGNFSLAHLVGFDLHGKTVGVIGTGKIGQCFIKIMLGFGCKIVCFDSFPSKEVATWENCAYLSLDEVLAQADVISLHCPLLDSTHHMINSETIGKMKKGVFLINTSRGGLINTPDLIKALKSKHIGAAGLDVYEQEGKYFYEDRSGDVMGDDILARLMTFSNVLVTSHQAFLTKEALQAIAQTTVFNIKEFLDGKRLLELTNQCK